MSTRLRLLNYITAAYKQHPRLSAGMSVKDIADKHGVPVKQIENQLKTGTIVESEHGVDEKEARNIALDHLTETPVYYTLLDEMEKKADKLK